MVISVSLYINIWYLIHVLERNKGFFICEGYTQYENNNNDIFMKT